ncbi:ribosome hibernation-promoting factor, HPF/YfiA family [Caviibacter abscessus]|uniref:ribosome hibernation-promoting factor, HPF/YfiA family n=1 Tax=Caviibacter abscessus TaxID=1766719 RepID=UPI00082F9F3C|nr:ribosome-associated translation inhibitor RaiA [Caviibacter abscessus]
MNIIISGQHLKITDPIREYAEEKCKKIGKYLENITEVHVMLTVEKTKSEGPIHKADATIYATGKKIRIESEDKDLYAAIDGMADKMERQVRKYKEKMKEKK